MPGGPPETLASAKRTIKGMFRKKSKGNGEAALDPVFETSSQSTSIQQAAAKPLDPTSTSETTSPSTTGAQVPQMTTTGASGEAEPVSRSMADEVDDAGTAAAASVKASDRPEAESQQAERVERDAPRTSDQGPDSNINLSTTTYQTQPSAIADGEAQDAPPPVPSKDTADTSHASTHDALKPTPHSPVDKNKSLPEGTTPPMSATSGPLEDNPILT